jgi:hypothetical protein
VSVPKTLLIDIEDTAISILFTAPTEAGQSFTTSTTTPTTAISVAITSNVDTAKLYAKAVTTDGDPLSNFNLELSVSGRGGIFQSDVTLSDSDIKIGDVGNHISGDLSSTIDKLKVTGGMVNANEMMPYGTYNTIITYTLKDS